MTIYKSGATNVPNFKFVDCLDSVISQLHFAFILAYKMHFTTAKIFNDPARDGTLIKYPTLLQVSTVTLCNIPSFVNGMTVHHRRIRLSTWRTVLNPSTYKLHSANTTHREFKRHVHFNEQ